MTNKEEPVDLKEKLRIMKRSHGEKKALAACQSCLSLKCSLSVEILPPAQAVCLSYRHCYLHLTVLAQEHTAGAILLADPLLCVRGCAK